MSERDDGGLAARHAGDLLGRLGFVAKPQVTADHPALAWRRAGLQEVTGRADGPGLVAPVALSAAADGALAALKTLAPQASLPLNGALLLGERARILELSRHGPVSANASCRLLAARDGGVALNLPRADDWELLPALLGEAASDWPAVTRAVARRDVEELVARGRLLGLAIAPDRAVATPDAPFRIDELGEPRSRRREAPLVVDLSSLWAGPLAGSLLRMAGARVIKVESRRRPDGARGGDRRVFDLMNAGKASVALDFADASDLERLRTLVTAADIVIESSRPRALAQLGVSAQETARAGATWISITAHGRGGEAVDFIGFGDDAAVAGGLSAAMRAAWGEPLFAGDAIADPLTGVTAALAGWAGWLRGGGWLVSLPLAEVVAHACGLGAVDAAEARAWQAMAEADGQPHYPMREAGGAARELGADTAAVLSEV
jgi:crotonobetainyl-CoA:carnitine CoA-transferase CaiB-like acyl-CoA transferase